MLTKTNSQKKECKTIRDMGAYKVMNELVVGLSIKVRGRKGAKLSGITSSY